MRCLLLAILGFSLAGGSFGQGKFVGAAAAGAAGKPSPLGAEEELATFTLPPGFQIELVAAGPDIAKVVSVAFDESGKMWAITAVEYPVDENESPERARALFAGKGRDRVLVFDTPTARGRQKPRTFADGLAIPLGVLPMRDGVLVGHGHDLLLLKHTDGDGRADQSEVLLTGFGIQDSHLFPHQFTRGLGDWIYLAQGAFNYSKVKDKSGRVTPFDQTKLARFRPDGTRYEIVGWGLNNIWGFVIDRLGETFIQEANDLGYPVVPFFVGANYPGIGMHRAKPYAPWQRPLADFSVGGTGRTRARGRFRRSRSIARARASVWKNFPTSSVRRIRGFGQWRFILAPIVASILWIGTTRSSRTTRCRGTIRNATRPAGASGVCGMRVCGHVRCRT